ncbi:crystallin beta/gamma motif-containing protein [Campylobacter vulpis]|uniref:PBECR2 nuclease fold domain-containing protein n=1 Tax=Campylobacter vulpis TaxID=1655500 RepID=UPI000C1608AA|nr:PBECR2 nuclease fold domain-containing protein [Campylobacter vulpis]MBS4306829.1 hypothetical protein [Campylobacter vulpis]PHY89927.1 hypothetical protein AA995_07255 [Campylobacter vulpis]QNF77856.1 crystallin beta/gamma motif-containing protein [Campylobacter vulpis]
MTFDFDKALEAGYNEQEIYNFLKDNNEKQNLGYDFANLEKKHKDFNAVWQSIKNGDKGQLSEAEKEELERQKRADLLAKREAENKAFEAEKTAFSKELEKGRFFKNMAEGLIDDFVPVELDKYAFKGLNKLGLDLKTKEQRDKFDKAFLAEAKEKLKSGDENLNFAQKTALFNRHKSSTKRNIEREKAMLKLENKEDKFSKEEMELIKEDLGFFNTLFNDRAENIKEFKEKRKSEAVINEEIIKAMNTLKQFDEGNLFRNALFADEKEALAFKQNMLKDAYKIAELQGFDDVGLDKEGELYFIKNEKGKEQKYLVNTGFFDNFWQSFFEDSKHEIGGAIIGGLAGTKRGKTPFTRGLNSVIGAAVGSAGGGFIDAKIADMKLNKEANFKANLEYALQAGLLSAAGDTALITAYHLAKPAFKGAIKGVKGTYNYAKNHSVLGLFSSVPTQNISAANKIIDEVFTPEMKEELKQAQKEFGGGVRGEDLASPVFEKLKENFAKKYGQEDAKTQKIAKLAEIFNANSLKTKQQEMLDLIRSDKDGSTLAYLLEVAKDDVKIQNNLKNMLNLASANVEKNLKNLNINPREIKQILDEFEAGNKTAFKEVESQIAKLYNDDIKVVLDRNEYENIKKDFLENGVNLDEMTPFLRDLENNVFSKEGVTFSKLNNFRKNLNYYIFNKDKTPNFINTLKKIAQTSLKAEIDRGIDNIFKELPNAYKHIKELYSTSLKDYAAMKELGESIKNLKLQDTQKSADEVVNSLIKYAKGQGENGVNNLQKIKDYLGEENNAFLEMQILNRLFKESVVENDRAKLRVFDSEGFLKRVKELVGDTPAPLGANLEARALSGASQGPSKQENLAKYTLNKDEARLFLENLNGAKIPEKLNIEDFIKELESVENKENFITHLSKKEDAKSRLAYLNLVKPTLEEADLILQSGKRQDYIKKFRDEKGFYTLLITEENGKRLITFLPKTREDFIKNKIDNASLIQSFTSRASKQGNGLANESIAQNADFGENFEGFKGKEAIEKLLKEQRGQVANAFYKEGLGEIDLVWGDSKKGLNHILERRKEDFIKQGLDANEAYEKALEFVEKIPQIIEQGEVKIGKNRAFIDTKENRALIALDYKGKDKKWVITAYKINDPSQADTHLTRLNTSTSSVSRASVVDESITQPLFKSKEAREFLEQLSPSAMPKQISIDEFLSTLENFKNKENFLRHIEKDPKRKDYLNLIEPTLKEPDISFKKLENGVDKEKFIKKFSDGKDFFYLLATKDNKETILTAFKTDKINTILKEFNADIIPTFIRQGSKGKAAGTTTESITQPLFKSKEAREFLELVEGFDKLYKNDALIAKSLTHATSEKLGTSIATSAEGAIKQKVVKGAFDPIFRLLPDGILFGLFSKQIQGGALRYHLKKALSRSLNYDDFKLKLERELKRTYFNSNTSRLINEFLQNLDEFNAEKEAKLAKIREEEELKRLEEQARLNKIKAEQEQLYQAQEENNLKDILEATQSPLTKMSEEHTLTKETQKEWLETFGLKSLDEDFIPNLPHELKEALGKEIKLTKGSLYKIVEKGREKYIPQVKQTLQSPDFALRDRDNMLILAKQIEDKQYFTSINLETKDYFISISNAPKKENILKNKVENGAKILYQSPNAKSIFYTDTLLQTDKSSANKIDEESIAQKADFGVNFSGFKGKEAINKLLEEKRGQVKGAFYKEGLGEIDLVWGNDSFGLKHILERRTQDFINQGLEKDKAEYKVRQLLNEIPQILENGKILSQNNDKIELITDKYTLVLGLRDDKKFIVTELIDKRNKKRLEAMQTGVGDSFTNEPLAKTPLSQNQQEIIPQESKSIKEEEIKEFLKNYGEQINSNYPQETARLMLEQNKNNGIVLSGFEIKGKDYDPQLELLEFKSKKAQREFETLMKGYDTKGDFLKFEKMGVFKPNDDAFLQYLNKHKGDQNAKLSLAYNLSKDLIRMQGGGRLDVFITNFLRQMHILENQNSTIYQTNPHLGAGLVGGTLNGVEQDENGNLSFDAEKFALGFLGGSLGSKAVGVGFKHLEKNPELKEKIINELSDTLALGFEKAREKYLLLSLLEPRYIVQNERGRKIQAKAMLKELESEQKGLFNVAYNGKNATLIKKDLEAVEEAIALMQGTRYKGAKHERIKHLTDPSKEGYITDLEFVNLGKSIREFLESYEPFIDKNGARIYEWENKDRVRFRVVVNDVADMDSNPTTATEEIITFYSDRNLKDKMKFKNPLLNETIAQSTMHGEALSRELEKSFLDESGKIDEKALNHQALDLPKSLSEEEFLNQISFKDKKGFSKVKTPIGDISVNLAHAWKHLHKGNTYKKDRSLYSGAFLDTLTDPLFVVKQEYTLNPKLSARARETQNSKLVQNKGKESITKDSYVFFKPYKIKNKFNYLIGYALDINGEIINTTFIPMNKKDFGRIKKIMRAKLLYQKSNEA